MSELKPCPFCGGLPYQEKTLCDFTIRCTICGATVSTKNDNNCAIVKPSAADLWNTRASTPPQETDRGLVERVARRCRDVFDATHLNANAQWIAVAESAIEAMAMPSKAVVDELLGAAQAMLAERDRMVKSGRYNDLAGVAHKLRVAIAKARQPDGTPPATNVGKD